MSGTNALSGLAVIGAITATGSAVYFHNRLFGYIAIFFAIINVAGGFGVTERMLQMFKGSGKDNRDE
jgi:NAD(P) transhydrogenase subunit alpha